MTIMKLNLYIYIYIYIYIKQMWETRLAIIRGNKEISNIY